MHVMKLLMNGHWTFRVMITIPQVVNSTRSLSVKTTMLASFVWPCAIGLLCTSSRHMMHRDQQEFASFPLLNGLTTVTTWQLGYAQLVGKPMPQRPPHCAEQVIPSHKVLNPHQPEAGADH
jgi:hypothetical protein